MLVKVVKMPLFRRYVLLNSGSDTHGTAKSLLAHCYHKKFDVWNFLNCEGFSVS